MGQATLAVYTGPGHGERLYRAAADVFGFPAWQVLWAATRTGSLGAIAPDSYPGLRFTPVSLPAWDGTSPHACMVQRVQDGKARGAVVIPDGAVMLIIRAWELRRLDELFTDLAEILGALPEDTVVRVWASSDDYVDVMETSVADLIEVLVETTRNTPGSG